MCTHVEGQAPQKVARLAQHCLDPINSGKEGSLGPVYMFQVLCRVDGLRGIAAAGPPGLVLAAQLGREGISSGSQVAGAGG
jgi:hypothetical protein